MRLRHALPVALAGWVLAVQGGGCASEGAGPGLDRPTVMSHSGPKGWTMRVLRHPPPYGLVVYVEPGYPDTLQESRSVILVGKALLRDGRALSAACEDQWNKERAKIPGPRDRIPIRANRGEGIYAGWEAKRSLHDGSVLRLRALCGNTDVGTAFIFFSAPDQSALYEPVWERLLLLNLGDARER